MRESGPADTETEEGRRTKEMSVIDGEDDISADSQ